MKDIWQGITIGGAGGAIAGITVWVVQYIHTKYLNNYCIWLFNISFIKIYTYYLFWYFYWYSYAACNDICFNPIAIFIINS